MISKDKNIFKQNKHRLNMNNKRGQGLSTNAIILIILGIIILVILVLGFTMGWNRLLPFVSSNNIENIQTGCNTACSTGNSYNWCQLPREVNDGVNKKFTETCYNLATNPDYISRNYGISPCESITCNP